MAQQAIVTPRPATTARPRKRPSPVMPATAEIVTPRPSGPATETTAKSGAKTAAKNTVKRETNRVKATATTQAKQVKGTAVGQTKVVARTAKNDVRELSGTVRDQADMVKGELAGQAREMLAETQGQLRQQADMQASRVASVLFQVGSQAEALAEGRPAQAGPLVDYAEQAAMWLDDAASHIEERGLEGLATDVVDFARRRPGVFLAGAAVVGFGVGRLIRSGAISADGHGTGDGIGELEA